MHIHFGDITRGEGKIYQEIIYCCPPGKRLVVSSSSDKRELPCILLKHKLKKDAYVLTLAAVSCAQRVVFDLVDESGEVVDSTSESITYIRAALISKFNTLNRKTGIESIRNMDWAPIEGEAHIECLFAIMNRKSKTRTLYFRVSSLGEGPGTESFDFKIMKKDGSLVDTEGQTVLRDLVFSDEKGRTLRKIDLSCRVDCRLDDLIAWIKFDSPERRNGFLRLLPFRLNSVKAASDALMFRSTGMGWDYQDWFLGKHRTSAHDISLQRNKRFKIEPMFSIIVPLYKTPISYFREMLNSVIGQSYSKFELILVNASPEDKPLQEEVLTACRSDDRIRNIVLDDNYGITLNTNEGIKAAKGDFLCFFDHDDVIEPDLLFEYVKGINEYPNTDLLYCDEDKLVKGNYADGFLKPDFDWDLICACNYVCHLLTVRKSIVDSFPCLPGKQYDGSQDHNMTLLVAEKARNIYHARKVLYHWRVHPGSTAGSPGAKPWTQESGRVAVQEHLDRCGISAKVSDHEGMDNYYDVDYVPESVEKLVSIIIYGGTSCDCVRRCVKSILDKTRNINYELIVVGREGEAALRDLSVPDKLKGGLLRTISVSPDRCLNRSDFCNAGAKAACGDYLLFLSGNTLVDNPLWLERIVGHLEREKVGCIGAKLLYLDGSIRHVGIALSGLEPVFVDELRPEDADGYFCLPKFPHNVEAVSGGCLAVRSDLFFTVGCFDTAFSSMYSDVDFCLKLREMGYLVVVDPRIQIKYSEFEPSLFKEKGSSLSANDVRELGLLMAKYADSFAAGDSYYNCNLRKGSSHYELG